ncbi:MAG: PilZ domain-containing protein [Ardenticatenaceae bacterium]|nr:PilZ domain-containing protein [Ardenticatenaceae bacterium]
MIRDRGERRAKPRISEPYPATVRGLDGSGWAFEEETVLDNLSAGGLYLRLPRSIHPGARLFIVFRLSTSPYERDPSSVVAVRGVVLRAELQPDGSCGLAVTFRHYRFL